MSKKFQIEGDDLSDGYHTFDELYNHRHALFLTWLNSKDCPDCYVIENHFDSWDLIVCEWMFNPTTNPAPYQRQISYHIPTAYRNYYKHIPRRSADQHDYDGHTSKEVVQRLYERLNFQNS